MACSMFTFTPPTRPTPTITATVAATATDTPAPTLTPTPFNKDGLWGGGTNSDATLSGEIQFYVQNNNVLEIGFNYTLRHNGCMEMASMVEKVDESKMEGNEFTARITNEPAKRQLIITGTMTSASEASGTLEFKGVTESCGEFSKSAKWTARPLPPQPTLTPTATQPPTATRAPATPGDLATPAGWVTLRSARFAINVPSSFETQVALRDVRLDPGTAQLILLGEDLETRIKVDVTETPALFGNAQRKLENRKSDFGSGSGQVTVLKAETGITVNGRDAAILEYITGGMAAVECFIVVGQEEFDIVIQQGNPSDTGFIARAEQIVNSFLVDTPVSLVTPSRWTTLKSGRLSITMPSSFQATVPFQDVQPNQSGKQTILSGDDGETGLAVMVVHTKGSFDSAEQWLEEAKKFCSDPPRSGTPLAAQTGIKINGRSAALLACSLSDYVSVEYFIRVGREDFQILVWQKQPTDANFILNAERIANSFLVNTAESRVTPTLP